MKITELAGTIKNLEMSAAEAEALIDALQRFGTMSIFEFSAFLKKQKAPSSPKNLDEIVGELRNLRSQPSEFDKVLERFSKSLTKQDLQILFADLFETRSKLPASLKKPEMLERIKRQRRRDANFASA